MSIKIVFFDMGGTIQNFWTNRELRLRNISPIRNCLQSAGISFDLCDAELVDLISQGISTYHKWNRESQIELSPLQVWSRYVLKDTGVTEASLAPIAEELSYLYETKFYGREMRPEIPQVLERIRRMGLRMGIVSNTQSQCQVKDNLKSYGIIHYFDPIVLSCQYGLRKPDASIFYHAAQLANVPTSSCVYVGDKINRDIIGARRSGMRLAVKINHVYDDGEKDEGATPDAVIENMNELVPLIEKEMERGRLFEIATCSRKIKALFFDAGDILYYRPHKQKNFKNFLANKQLEPVPDLEKKAKEIRELAFQGKMDRFEYYRQTVKLYGITDSQQIEEGAAAFDLDDDTVAIFEGVPLTIRTLKERGYLLGIITDTALPYTVKLRWFSQYGFGDLWDVIVSSKELGIRKPAPILYQQALHQAGLQPGEAIFVGHKAYELEGARKVGFRTVAFNYEKEAVADTYIKKFSELLDIALLTEKVEEEKCN